MANDNLIRGIDVSHHQGDIDWASVASSGVKFAFLKATQGNHHVDDQFATYRAGAKAQGIATGFYHFADLSMSAESNAKHFMDTVGKFETGDLLPVLDLERDGIPDGTSASDVNQWALDFAIAWSALSDLPLILYAQASRAKTPEMLEAYPYLWVAHWKESEPKGPFGLWDTWAVWQHSDRGQVAGINAKVDLDYIRPEDMAKLTVGGGSGGGGLGLLAAVGLGLLALTR